MRVLFASLLVIAAAEEQPDYNLRWKHFKEKHVKSYGSEDDHRFQIFKENLEKITEHNDKKLSFRMRMNKFGDLTRDEFSKIHLQGYRPETRGVFSTVPFPPSRPDEVVADTVDWVTDGAVTSVKDQEMCGSCWAFSAVGAIEGAYAIAGGQLTDLSVGEIVQCENYGDLGCEGGIMDNAFKWVEQHGIASAQAYPYTSGSGITGQCREGVSPVVTVTGYTMVPEMDENALKSAVVTQPVSVAVEASGFEWQMYGGGILDSATCGQALDHAVLVVGYSTEGMQDYWKVKNTWSTTWGEEGYIRIARGKNMCGIADYAVYPTGAKDADHRQIRGAPTRKDL